MAESLGQINTGYTPARPTDDLIQSGAGLRETQRLNMVNQMQTRTQDSMMSAANVSSQIADRQVQAELRARQVDSDIAYKNNLVDMNISREERAWQKLPYELRGLKASNWVNETVARGNELKNHLAEATMSHNIEQEALETEVQYASLQDLRQKTEVARRQIQTETENRPKFNDYWDKVDSGIIDPEQTPRPDYEGNKALGKEHDDRIKIWRGNQAEAEERARAANDIQSEGKEMARMSAVQRKAVEEAKNPDIRRDYIYQAKRTNDALESLKEYPAGNQVIEYMAKGIDPATGAQGNKYFGPDGNLLNEGYSVLNTSLQKLSRNKSQADYNMRVAATREAALLKAQSDTVSRKYADEGKRREFIAREMNKILERNAEDLAADTDGTTVKLTRDQAMDIAAGNWNRMTGASAQTEEGGASPDPLANVSPENLTQAKMGIAVLKRLGKFVRDTATAGTKNYEGVERKKGYSVAGMNSGWDRVAADEAATFGGYDLDIEDTDVEGLVGEPNPMIQKSSALSTDDNDSIAEAASEWSQKLLNAGVGVTKIVEAVQPHPAHLKLMRLRLPTTRGRLWAYIEDNDDMRWFQIDTPPAGTSDSEKEKLAKKAAGDRGAKNKVWLQGVHFNANGNPTDKQPK